MCVDVAARKGQLRNNKYLKKTKKKRAILTHKSSAWFSSSVEIWTRESNLITFQKVDPKTQKWKKKYYIKH